MKKKPKMIIQWKYGNHTPEEIAEMLRPYIPKVGLDINIEEIKAQLNQRSISDKNNEEMDDKLPEE